MKTKLFAILLLLTGAFAFTSCDSDSMDEDYLEGIWWSVDDPYDQICLQLSRNGSGVCTETYYDQYGVAVGIDTDLFDWYVRNGQIHVIFRNGYTYSGQRWIWYYDIADGHTVNINGRYFTRDRSYYHDWYDRWSKKYQPAAGLFNSQARP
jgi:hypothetical protein